MIRRAELTADERQQVGRIIERSRQSDGYAPANESGSLIVAGERRGSFYLEHDQDQVIGFAVADPREATIQAAVDPDHRRRGHGRQLVAAALEDHHEYQPWAFGTLEGAVALAASLGLQPVRELLLMAKDLAPSEPPEPPSGIQITGFREDDAQQVAEVNRLAFAHHPEQGKLSLDEFYTLTRQPWFDPAGLLVARQATQVVGFHWTKRHDQEVGEVYVLAVHPEHEGRGLGRVLLEAGLHHLAATGAKTVHLYVEASEARVVRLYESARFRRVSMDTSFAAST